MQSSQPIINAANQTVNFDASLFANGNTSFTVVIGDQNGNKFSLAPGLVGLPVQFEGLKPTYNYAVLGFTPVATPTDVLVIQGSASRTIRVRLIQLTGVATAAGNMPVQLIRRSAANSGAAALTALNAFRTDTSYGAATAVVSTVGTANFTTLGAAAGGPGWAGRVSLAAAGSGVGISPLSWPFDVNAAVLRGASDFLCLNMNGAGLPGGAAFDMTILTQEDNS